MQAVQWNRILQCNPLPSDRSGNVTPCPQDSFALSVASASICLPALLSSPQPGPCPSPAAHLCPTAAVSEATNATLNNIVIIIAEVVVSLYGYSLPLNYTIFYFLTQGCTP
jgi:hypothetical protein